MLKQQKRNNPPSKTDNPKKYLDLVFILNMVANGN